MPFDNPMILGVLLLTILPIIGTLLWLLKKVLKLSFSVGKILLVLFAIWFVFTAVTGGLSDVFGNISKPRISCEDDNVNYLSAFSDTELDLSAYQAEYSDYIVNSAFSRVKVLVPEGTVVRLNAQGFGSCVLEGEEKTPLIFGQNEMVIGNGSNVVEVRANIAFMMLEFVVLK